MPEHVPEEDKIIQGYPLEWKSENIKVVPASELFKKWGTPI